MILPDTSVWIEYLRADRTRSGGSRLVEMVAELDARIDTGDVVMCGPVVAELLAGARGRQHEELAARMRAQQWIEMARPQWLETGHVAAKLLERGEVVPLVDIQIAVCASDGDAEVWTRDQDFKRIAKVLEGLRLRVAD